MARYSWNYNILITVLCQIISYQAPRVVAKPFRARYVTNGECNMVDIEKLMDWLKRSRNASLELAKSEPENARLYHARASAYADVMKHIEIESSKDNRGL